MLLNHSAYALALILTTTLTAQDSNKPDPSWFAEMRYRCVGPSRGGRVTTVTGVPKRHGEFYMGSTGGGVWKTVDFGASWHNVTDGFLTTGSVGAIRVAPSNPDVVYVGTGSDALRSNVITGRGVFKSTDAGKTWTCAGLEKVGQIGAVEIHPEDPNTVFVAAIGQTFQPNRERGIYRTHDGGKTWRHVLSVSETIGFVDLELHPTDPKVIYACSWRAERKPWTIISGARGCGIYRSTDGGTTWKQLHKGLPDGVVGKSDLAVSRADPNRVYALIEAGPGKGGVYRSDDRGDSFELVSTHRGLLDRPFYYCNIDADPTNADVLYVNSTRAYRSTDAGKTWRTMATPHGDNHDIWLNPDDAKLMIQANDGGANVSIDGGKTWSTQNNQPTAELYQIAVDDRFPYWLYAGQQDNTTIRVPSQPPYPAPAGAIAYWQSVGGCETGPVIPKPGDPDIVYANCKGRFGRFDFRTGQEKQFYIGATNMYGHNPKNLEYRFQRVAPIAVSPFDPNVVYHASQYLHMSRDEGRTWRRISPDLTAFEPDKQVISGEPLTRDITGEEFYSTIYEVCESKLERGLIWVGANDGPIHVTKDAGKTWKDVTPRQLPKGGRVQTIEPSPHKAGKAYAAVLRYQLGDWRPHVYRTEDYGKSWTLLTNGKNGVPPGTPCRVVREDPDREGLLYLGTEFGMYVSFDDGKSWQSMQLNLPVTPVTDLVVKNQDLVLSTMGRSFWILDDVSRLHSLADAKTSERLHVFPPRPAHRARFPRVRGAGVQYLTTGAFVDYWLAEDADKLLLEVVDSTGKVIRSVSKGLSAKAGAHRYRWDLRHSGPQTPSSRRSGPLVSPGTYTLRLTAGDLSRTTTIEVKIDPRVAADGVTQDDLVAQEQLSLRIQALATKARVLSAEVLDKLTDKPKDKDLERVHAELVTSKDGRYEQPMLLDQIRYLSNMLDRADQRPGKDAYERCTELEAWFERLR